VELEEELELQKKLGEKVFGEKEALIEKLQDDFRIKQEQISKETS